MIDNTPCSAQAAMEAEKREQKERERIEREKAIDRSLSLQTIEELRIQNALMKKERDESLKNLEKSERYNRIMLVVAVVSMVVAIASFVVAIIALAK